ncbi:MAG: DNA polymerase III subunit alpha [Anaerolineae bacterium]
MQLGETFYMRSPDEMAALFPEFPEAIRNTVRIAEMVDFKMAFGEYHLPVFPVPDGYTAETYLRALCEEGLQRRYGAHANDLIVRERLEHELAVIHQMGFDAYFLIVWDLCRFARSQNIWYNARGSAAGSIVAYTLNITLVDPVHHDLIFERFLNPGRLEMPDIDLDFPDDRRESLINYAMHKYGSDKVAQIITFGTLGARAALRDSGRALDMPLAEVDRIARMVPAVPGKPVTIKDVMNEEHEFFNREFKDLFEADPTAKHLIETAQSLEGVSRHASTHAAGVVVADRPIVEYCPLHRPTKGDSENAPAVTQFPMEIINTIGLLKVDFLGLATLTVMQRAAKLIEKYHGVSYNLDTIPTDDPIAFKLLASGAVQGVFQVEGPGMRRILQDMKPTRLEHIIALVALYRPGPLEFIPNYIRRMHGKEEVTYLDPGLEPILKDTYGILVYQEQVMRTAIDLAGYTATEADKLRKAIGKKKKDDLLKQRDKFVSGAVKKGTREKTANEIFDYFEAFARYGFNKGHAADYAVVTVQTAWLKAMYPVEYMTALMSVERGDTEKIGALVADCVALGIKVLPPDVNRSGLDFDIEALPDKDVIGKITHHRAIRFGLTAVKNVGEGPIQTILDARGDKPFASLDEFARRVDLRQVNRRALECLIKAGAFDSFGNRAQLLGSVEPLMSISSEHHRAQDVGQMSLFGGLGASSGPAAGGGSLFVLLAPTSRPAARRWPGRRTSSAATWASIPSTAWR